MKIGVLLSGLIFGLVSCKTTDFVGHYELRHYPKTSIELRADGTFEFTKINPNPYLHPFDHPEEYYFITNGTWKVENNRLTLNSFRDSVRYRSPEIIELKEDLSTVDTTENLLGEMWQPRSYSTLTFFDIFGDTVKILGGQSPDGTEIYRLHRSMESLYWSTVWSDTLEFHFYGYRPYTFTRTDKVRRIVSVRLFPERRGSVFIDRQFIINRKRIKGHKIRFDKKTTAQQK